MTIFNLSTGFYDNDDMSEDNDILIDEETFEISFGDNDNNCAIFVSDHNTQNYLRYAIAHVSENHQINVTMFNNGELYDIHLGNSKVNKHIACLCDDFIINSNEHVSVYKLVSDGFENYHYMILDIVADQLYLTKYIHYNYSHDDEYLSYQTDIEELYDSETMCNSFNTSHFNNQFGTMHI